NKSLSEVLTSIGENPKKYPTIFHLRNALLNEDKPFDPRLIYIALHNLVKYRSHFLNEHMEWASSSSENESTFDLIQQYLNMLSNVGYPVNNSLEYMHDETLNNIVQVLESNEHTNSDKRNAIKKLIGKEFHEPISLIVGLKSDMYKLFPNSGNAQIYQDEKLKISFTEEDITEVYEKLLEEEKLIIDQANKIFQHLLLSDLLSGFNCVAEAKVHAYNEFRDDLNLLKEIYNEYCRCFLPGLQFFLPLFASKCTSKCRDVYHCIKKAQISVENCAFFLSIYCVSLIPNFSLMETEPSIKISYEL